MSRELEGLPVYSKSPSEIRLLEKIRLQSFHGLLPGADNRIRSPGKHPPVLIEDLLKAEVISLQLVLAIEDVAKSVKQILNSENEPGVLGGSDSAAIANGGPLPQHFQDALAQGASAINELTKLQISDNCSSLERIPQPLDSSSRIHNNISRSMVSSGGPEQSGIHHQNGTVAQRLRFDSGTPSMIESSWLQRSVRVSESIMLSDDDMSHCTSQEGSVLVDNETNCENMECNEETMVQTIKDLIKTLRNEMEELQAKHEKQFITFAAKYWNQDEDQSMRELLGKIVANLSRQDKNWTHHGKFDEHGMEQLFYFVSLQKTLKNCLAIVDTIKIEDKTEQIEHEVHDVAVNTESLDSRPIPQTAFKTDQTNWCFSNQIDSCRAHNAGAAQGQGSLSMNNIPKTHLPLDDDNQNVLNNCSSETNCRKRKKNKSIFACFNAGWSKRRKQK